MITADDIEVGQYLTVLNGDMRPMSPWADHEVCGDLKGIPLHVLSIDLPYLLVAPLGFSAYRIVDVRDVELQRVADHYVLAFIHHVTPTSGDKL